MQTVPFGSLGFEVSRLGFGAMRLPTMQEGENQVIDRKRAIGMIRRGIDAGITYVDTAYPYHRGESEIVVGQALKDGYREKVKLTTKLPLWSVHEEADMNRLLDEQLKKLDVPYVDFYLLHAMNRDRLEQMRSLHYKDFLKQALGDGRIKNAGFSFHDEYKVFSEILHDWDEWHLAQIQFNYLDNESQATEKGLREAGKMGIPIVVMEPLRGGALANPPKVVRDLMGKRSPIEWAFAYVADFAEVATILSGMSAEEQLEENLKAFEHLTVGGLSEEEHALIRQFKAAYRSLMPIGCTGCRYCQPCPQNVHIPDIFVAYNESRMFSDPGTLRWHYKEHVEKGEDASQCVGCGACEGICPQHLPIIDLLKKVDGEYKAL